MRHIIIAFIFALATISFPQFTLANTLTDAEAINISGRQRMLSQRMMKNYLLIGADIKSDVSQKQLDASVALFEEQLNALNEYAPTSIIRNKLSVVEDLWFPHRMLIIGKPTKVGLAQLMNDNVALLKACDNVVKEIEKHANIQSAKLVNISGRQRMLSQRIAKTYAALYWKAPVPGLLDEFAQAITLFDQSLQELIQYDRNSEQIKYNLERVHNQWQFSQSGFKLEEEGRYVPTVISVTTESILKKMDQITGQYQDLMNYQVQFAQQ